MELSKICRICLLTKNDMEDIFDVIDVITTIAPIQLEKADGLPSTICSDCSMQANQAYNFRQLCIQSDVTLRYQALIKEEPQDIPTYTDNSENDMKSVTLINDEEENTNELDRVDSDNDGIEEMEFLTKLNCRFCNEEFDSRNDYREHEQNHKEELKCHICGKKLSTYTQFSKHYYMHRQKGSYLCNTCGKVFTRLEILKMHERIHAGIKRYKCSVCDKSFVQSNELKSHILTHTKEKSQLCNICGNKYARARHLQYHIKHKHMMPPDARPYVCVCGKSFRNRAVLSQHQRSVHTTERKYVCGECNKGYKSMKHLRQHEKIHKGDKPFVCTICERAFIFKHVLQSHMNTHSK